MSKKGWADKATKLNYCNGKPSYDKRGAQTARNSRKKKGIKLRIYHCPDCNMWHLAHPISTNFEVNRNYK